MASVPGDAGVGRISFDKPTADKGLAVIWLLGLNLLEQALGSQLRHFGTRKAAKAPGFHFRPATIQTFPPFVKGLCSTKGF